jgi:hypothetical protein
MSNARNLARVIVDSSGDIAANNLDNAVPADGSITAAKLAASLDLSSKTLSYPNGSVVADDLASTLDLTGKTVTLPVGTGGKLLQAVRATTTTNQSWTTSSFFDLWLNSFTPISASSTLHFLVSLNFLNEASNTHDVWMDYRGANGQYFYSWAKAGTLTGWSQSTMMACYSCPSGGTTAATLRIQARGNGSNASYFNYPGSGGSTNGRSSILMLEVA